MARPGTSTSLSRSEAKLEEAYHQDNREKYEEVYSEDEKEPPRKNRHPTPVFEAYPAPPPPEVTFIRPHRLRSWCIVMGFSIILALSLTLNFVWITVALNRSIGPGFPGFGHRACTYPEADTPAINFSPQIDVYPAQGRADGLKITVTSITTLMTTMLSSFTPTQTTSSDTPRSTTVVTIAPQQSTVNSTTIITVTPIESESPRSTVYSTTIITSSPTGKDTLEHSIELSDMLTLQQGRIPDNSALSDDLPSSSTTRVTVTPTGKTVGEANHSQTSLTACESAALKDPDGAVICP